MASPNIPSYGSSSSNCLPPVTQEEFKMFHNIDRKLFTRLLVSLSGEIGQSMQVIAFLLWLEHQGLATDLIHQMNSFRDYMLIPLVDEVVLCLKCIESPIFDPNSEPYINGVPLVETVTKNVVSVYYLRTNRIKIINEVTRNVTDVCVRAFDDIASQVQSSRQQGLNQVQSSRQQGLNQVQYYGPQQATPPVHYDASAVGAYGMPNFQQYVPPPVDPNVIYNNIGIQTHMTWPSGAPGDSTVIYNNTGIQAQMAGPSSVALPDPNVVYNNIGVQTRSLDDDINEGLGLLKIRTGDDHHRYRDRKVMEEDAVVPPDDRTIFLTFSKGYPISENEVKDFFTGMIGDCIESIYMQEVPAGEQPFYARLVVPSQSVIEAVLDGRSKAKFSINGKHVWARKYVRKNSTRSANSPPSQPSSPVAH